MRTRPILFPFFLLLFTFVTRTHSQTYPVQVTPRVSAAIPPYLPTWADPTLVNPPLQLQLLLQDLEQAQREVYLEISLKSNSLDIWVRPEVSQGHTFFLEGGIPLWLGAAELSAFFQPEALSGLPADAWYRLLPEGMYEFCVLVRDVLTGKQLSAPTCVPLFLNHQDPPLLTNPGKAEVIRFQPVQRVRFQWVPRQIGLSEVRYQFRLVEVWDEEADVQAVFFASVPVYEEEVGTTWLELGPEKVQLLPGRRYAWNVRAVTPELTGENSWFKNQGHSEVYHFIYTLPCDIPLSVSHEVKGAHQATLSWLDTSENLSEFLVRFRKAEGNHQWFYQRSTTPWVSLWDLDPGTTYEYQVSRQCEGIESEFSPLNQFTTAETQDEISLVSCGIGPGINTKATAPLQQLEVNESFKAGDFEVRVLEVKGKDGRFSGKGYVRVPYLNNLRVSVSFSQIYINDERELAEGIIITGYDKTWSNVLDTDVLIDRLEDVGDIFNGPDRHMPEVVPFPLVTKDIKVTDDEILVSGPEGTQIRIDRDPGDTYLITDSEGNQWQIGPSGKVEQVGSGTGVDLASEAPDGWNPKGAGSPEAPSVQFINDSLIHFSFGLANESLYALDEASDPWEYEHYPKMATNSGGLWYPPHKAVVKGSQEIFHAYYEVRDERISIDSVWIQTTSGREIPFRKETGTATLTIEVTGLEGYRAEEAVILVRHPDHGSVQVVGSFFLHHLPLQQPHKVIVVRTSGVPSISDLQETLDHTFGAAGIPLEVEEHSQLLDMDPVHWDIKEVNGRMDYDGSGLLSDYPEELKAFIDHFKRMYPDYDRSARYLFYLDEAYELSTSVSGFMPRSRAFGFLFAQNFGSASNEYKPSVAMLAAHELGHGLGNLSHPEGEEYALGQSTNYTNLMASGRGGSLGYMQWKEHHEGKVEFPIGVPDKESEYTDKEYMSKVFQQIRCAWNAGIRELPASTFQKNPGTFEAFFEDYGNLKLELTGETIQMDSGRSYESSEQGQMGTDAPGSDWLHFDYGGARIRLKKAGTIRVSVYKPDDLATYLHPSDPEAIQKDFRQVLMVLQGKSALSDEEIKTLKDIVNCGSEYFPVSDKFKLIRMVLHHSTLEYYEDLVLDLMSNHREPVAEYATAWISRFIDQPQVFRQLFEGLDNTGLRVLWQGNEDNRDRFFKLLYDWWITTPFSDPGKYRYVEHVLDGNELTPYHFAYDGKSLFPSFTLHEVSLEDRKLRLQVENQESEWGYLVYDPFQPVRLLGASETSGFVSSTPIPAVLLMGLAEEDDYVRTLKRWELAIDVAGTMVAFSNVLKLRHFTNTGELVTFTLAGIEFLSESTNLLLNYTGIFSGDPELQKAVDTYNFHLQMYLLGLGSVETKIQNAFEVLQQVWKRKGAGFRRAHPEQADKLNILNRHLLKRNDWARSLQVGDKIATFEIVRIKPGNGDKVVVIGRDMENRVLLAGEELQKKGVNVELFDYEYQKVKYQINDIIIDGKKYSWQDILEDLQDKDGKYPRDGDYISYEGLKETLMYKLNQQWIEDMVSKGYTILDIGEGPSTFKSAFYDMETMSVFNVNSNINTKP